MYESDTKIYVCMSDNVITVLLQLIVSMSTGVLSVQQLVERQQRPVLHISPRNHDMEGESVPTMFMLDALAQRHVTTFPNVPVSGISLA